jgi:hypothetical protein
MKLDIKDKDFKIKIKTKVKSCLGKLRKSF